MIEDKIKTETCDNKKLNYIISLAQWKNQLSKLKIMNGV
jgi:hypothetical protein